MRADEAQHVAWAYGKARAALTALASVNAELPARLRWAIESLGPVPRGGLPDSIIEQLRALDERMLAPVVDHRVSGNFTVVYWNIRKLSWKKRQALSDEIIRICVSICEACAVLQRRW
jgi:hypothetical protein